MKMCTITDILINIFPFVLIIALWIFMSRRLGGGAAGGGGVFSVGKSKARIYEKGQADRVTFKDVAGQAEAKTEVLSGQLRLYSLPYVPECLLCCSL